MTTQSKVAIELLKPHKHDGEKKDAGTTIHVHEHDAEWLKQHGVGKAVATETAPSSRQR
ncbi:hypothetical protein K6V72_24210 [Ralstonia insidiosa]|jgi:hypothetical protein|uniref:DUF7210 family protein n=1 Tax=Ralstonia TaxID=48736 RepID=UPI000A43409D|nr:MULTISPECIES: hypothetical protein [Ralstonia]MBY4912123.1 hypothetical protein [Ralstonia insidiosa]